MMKMKSKKGFTLAELLIVIAIIAVLVGIAIPVFGGIIDRANEATDEANLRGEAGQYNTYLLMDTLADKYYSDGVLIARTTYKAAKDAGLIEIPIDLKSSKYKAAAEDGTLQWNTNTNLWYIPTP